MNVATSPVRADPATTGAGIPLRRLAPEARREFEAILGVRDVSEDPTICASYAWCYGGLQGAMVERMISVHLPLAAVLPETTEEIAAVVKACLRHGLKYRPHSTGVGSYPNVMRDDAIVIDLRKMDRIIDLDADNQMAVIEPYVTAQQLMAESMKVGLMPHIIGAGWTYSPLASATSFGGVGPTGNHTGNSNRNLLAMEWVTPTGEIVRVGSSGQGDTWFAGEGPGPGFRGVIRGMNGGAGEMGVFTRIGYKLHPWMGPPVLEHTGANPQFGIKLSETMRVYHLIWPDWSVMAQATHDLLQADCATFIDRVPPDQIGWLLHPTNRSFYDAWVSPDIPPIMQAESRHAWTVMTVSESVGEAEWRERVIHKIVADNRGTIMPVAADHAEVIARNMVTGCYVPRVYRAAPRGVMTSVGLLDTPSLIPKVMKLAETTTRPYKQELKSICGGYAESTWMWTSEGRQFWGENVVVADNDKARSWAHMLAYYIDAVATHDRAKFGIDPFIATTPLHDTFNRYFKANLWMRRVKMLFDPGINSEGMMMPVGPISPFRRFWPVLNLLRRYAPVLFRFSLQQQIDAGVRARRKTDAKRRAKAQSEKE